MSVIHTANIEEFKSFVNQTNQLTVLERKVPPKASSFFNKLIKINFTIFGKVHKDRTIEDIKFILDEEFTKNIKNDVFYKTWINDISQLCKLFCDLENSSYISIWLSSKRGCKRYHIDNVPKRLLVTYAGQGTEWIPDEAADREAYANGDTNENIIKNNSAKKFIREWDVAIFKGGPNGLLHRTPDVALNGPSILMRLDYAKYWDQILTNHEKYYA